MNPWTLFYFARVKPLAAWSISSSIVGIGIAAYLTNWHLMAAFPLLLSVIGVVLIQYVAHPLNDIMDLDLDRQAPIEATGRVKPIVSGLISVKETRWLSSTIIIIILAIAAYLIILQPFLLFPAAFGLGALFAYNSSALRFAYKPFTELYLSMPVNAIAAFVVSYVGSGQLSLSAFFISVLYGFAASTFFVSMMSMDFPTDKINGKRTTIVSFPQMKWCTLFPLIGLSIAIISMPFIALEFGIIVSLALGGVSIAFFLVLIGYGRRVDSIRMQYLRGQIDNPEGQSGYVRLRQLYIAIAYAITLAGIFTILGA